LEEAIGIGHIYCNKEDLFKFQSTQYIIGDDDGNGNGGGMGREINRKGR
jgi:hypothetical protein